MAKKEKDDGDTDRHLHPDSPVKAAEALKPREPPKPFRGTRKRPHSDGLLLEEG